MAPAPLVRSLASCGFSRIKPGLASAILANARRVTVVGTPLTITPVTGASQSTLNLLRID